MAASEKPFGEPRYEGQVPETTTRKLREQSQLEFELDFCARVLERDSTNADVLRVHANNLAATGQYTRAMQADRRLVRLLPDRPIPWYNLACSYALLGMTEPALSALQRALELGYRHVRHMLRDPDLTAVRNDPRFAKMIRRF